MISSDFQPTTIPKGSSLYYALLHASPVQRHDATVLNTFLSEMNSIVVNSREPEIAKIKLNWWIEEIDRCYQNQSQHPLAKALFPIIHTHNLPQTLFDDFLQGMMLEIDPPHMTTQTQLLKFCQQIGGVKCALFCKIMGGEHINNAFPQKLGVALHLIHIIRQFGKNCRAKTFYIPDEAFFAVNLTHEQLIERQCEAGALFSLLQFQANLARQLYSEALTVLTPCERRAQRNLLIFANIYFTLLNEMERDKFAVLHHHTSLTPLRKLWVTWKTRFNHSMIFNPSR